MRVVSSVPSFTRWHVRNSSVCGHPPSYCVSVLTRHSIAMGVPNQTSHKRSATKSDAVRSIRQGKGSRRQAVRPANNTCTVGLRLLCNASIPHIHAVCSQATLTSHHITRMYVCMPLCPADAPARRCTSTKLDGLPPPPKTKATHKHTHTHTACLPLALDELGASQKAVGAR